MSRPIVALDGDDVTLRANVGDCMSWPVQEMDADFYSNGFNRRPQDPMPDRTRTFKKVDIDPYNNAQEAMRGWPRHLDEADGLGDGNWESSNCPCDNCSDNNSKRSKSGDKKGRKGFEKDPYMCDLIAHKFLTDAIEARDAKNKDAEEQEKREKELLRKMKGVKANRASQLRQINNSVPVEKDPMDLWKMPRFAKEAKPHLDTKRRKPKANKEPDMLIKGSPIPDHDSLVVRPSSYADMADDYHASPELGGNYHDEAECMVHFDD